LTRGGPQDAALGAHGLEAFQDVISPFNPNGLAVHQGVGNGLVGPSQHAGDRGPGNLELFGRLFVDHAEIIGQSQGLQFIHGDDVVFQDSQRYSLGFKKGHPRFPLYKTAFFWSGHFSRRFSILLFFNAQVKPVKQKPGKNLQIGNIDVRRKRNYA
jgi:hypothetical protein